MRYKCYTKFPPLKPTGSPDFMIGETIPQVDAIVGNFPYIRQELIEKRNKEYKDKLTNEPLKLGSYFIGQQEVVSESGFKYDTTNLQKAKFIIHAQKPNSFLIKIPKQAFVVIRAINHYERKDI